MALKASKKPRPPSARASTDWRRLARALPGAEPEDTDDAAFAPELAKSVELAPGGDDWLHEVKWDGYRLLTTIKNGKVRLWSRNAIEWTGKVPALVKALSALPVRNAHLDGEMVSIVRGVSNFNVLKEGLGGSTAALSYVVFDLMHLEGYNLRGVSLLQRKDLLRKLIPKEHPTLLFSTHNLGRGPEIFAAAAKAGLEGIISKRVESHYRPGRSGDWVKVKVSVSQEYAIVGYSEPSGSRKGLGALLLAQPAKQGWGYVGRVGTGMDTKMLRMLVKLLTPLAVDKAPLSTAGIARADLRGVTWVRPHYVVEVFFRGLGGNGLLRHASLKTLREDKFAPDLRLDADKPVKGRATKR